MVNLLMYLLGAEIEFFIIFFHSAICFPGKLCVEHPGISSEVKSLSRVRLFATPWTTEDEAPIFWLTDANSQFIGKDPDAEKN